MEIVNDSLCDAIQKFVADNKKEVKQLSDLVLYLMGSNRVNTPPTEFQKKFIEDFYTLEAWAYHINAISLNSSFVPRLPLDEQTINVMLSFEVIKLSHSKILELEIANAKAKLSKVKLQLDLEKARLLSQVDGEFSKIEGFLNIHEALIKHKILSRPK